MIEELNNLKFKIENLSNQSIRIRDDIDTLRHTENSETNEMTLSLSSLSFYRNAVDIVYERSIQQLKDVLNSALVTIFTDRQLKLDVVLSDKRGKSLTLVVTDNGKVVNLKNGMGMGVKCVISAILHIYYLQCKNSRVLMLDEAYSNISKEYVNAFFEFLSQLCKKLEFKLILITHDDRFLQYADKIYHLDLGVVDEQNCSTVTTN